MPPRRVPDPRSGTFVNQALVNFYLTPIIQGCHFSSQATTMFYHKTSSDVLDAISSHPSRSFVPTDFLVVQDGEQNAKDRHSIFRFIRHRRPGDLTDGAEMLNPVMETIMGGEEEDDLTDVKIKTSPPADGPPQFFYINPDGSRGENLRNGDFGKCTIAGYPKWSDALDEWKGDPLNLVIRAVSSVTIDHEVTPFSRLHQGRLFNYHEWIRFNKRSRRSTSRSFKPGWKKDSVEKGQNPRGHLRSREALQSKIANNPNKVSSHFVSRDEPSTQFLSLWPKILRHEARLDVAKLGVAAYSDTCAHTHSGPIGTMGLMCSKLSKPKRPITLTGVVAGASQTVDLVGTLDNFGAISADGEPVMICIPKYADEIRSRSGGEVLITPANTPNLLCTHRLQKLHPSNRVHQIEALDDGATSLQFFVSTLMCADGKLRRFLHPLCPNGIKPMLVIYPAKVILRAKREYSRRKAKTRNNEVLSGVSSIFNGPDSDAITPCVANSKRLELFEVVASRTDGLRHEISGICDTYDSDASPGPKSGVECFVTQPSSHPERHKTMASSIDVPAARAVIKSLRAKSAASEKLALAQFFAKSSKRYREPGDHLSPHIITSTDFTGAAFVRDHSMDPFVDAQTALYNSGELCQCNENDQDSNKCNLCYDSFPTSNLLFGHLRSFHSDVTCPEKHSLTEQKTRSRRREGVLTCNVCRATISSRSPTWRCVKCDYDACARCHSILQSEAIAKWGTRRPRRTKSGAKGVPPIAAPDTESKDDAALPTTRDATPAVPSRLVHERVTRKHDPRRSTRMVDIGEWHATCGQCASRCLAILKAGAHDVKLKGATDVAAELAKASSVACVCSTCLAAKSRRLPQRLRIQHEKMSDGGAGIWYIDTSGKLEESIEGFQYAVLCKSLITKFRFIDFLGRKNATVLTLTDLHLFCNAHRLPLVHLICDMGTEYDSVAFRTHCADLHIRVSYINIKSPSQMGLVEREWSSLAQTARSFIFRSRLPIVFWPYAMMYATAIANSVPELNLEGLSPSNYVFGAPANIRHWYPWGSESWLAGHVSGNNRRSKWSLKGLFAFYLGPSPHHPGSIFYVPCLAKIVVTQNYRVMALRDARVSCPLLLKPLRTDADNYGNEDELRLERDLETEEEKKDADTANPLTVDLTPEFLDFLPALETMIRAPEMISLDGPDSVKTKLLLQDFVDACRASSGSIPDPNLGSLEQRAINVGAKHALASPRAANTVEQWERFPDYTGERAGHCCICRETWASPDHSPGEWTSCQFCSHQLCERDACSIACAHKPDARRDALWCCNWCNAKLICEPSAPRLPFQLATPTFEANLPADVTPVQRVTQEPSAPRKERSTSTVPLPELVELFNTDFGDGEDSLFRLFNSLDAGRYGPESDSLGDFLTAESFHNEMEDLLSPENDAPKLNEAMDGPEKGIWRKSYAKEALTQIDLTTWMVIHQTWMTYTCSLLGSTVACRWKYEHGERTKAKLRMCPQGFRQIPGRDFSSASGATPRSTSIRLIFIIACYYGLLVRSIDVSAAYLLAPIDRELWMKRYPRMPGFRPGYECLLLTAAYGLRQSCQLWLDLVGGWLTDDADEGGRGLPFVRSKGDPCVFIRMEGKSFIIISIHIDDLQGIGSPDPYWDAFEKSFLKRFPGRRQPDGMHWHLGCGVHQLQVGGDDHSIRIEQVALMRKAAVMGGVDLESFKPVNTPLPPHTILTACPETLTKEEQALCDNFPYRTVVGMGLYLCLLTMPGLCNAVHQLSRACHCYGPDHVEAAKYMCRFLAGYANDPLVGITYRRNRPMKPEVWVDSNWASDPSDRRSTFGYVITMLGASASWGMGRSKVLMSSSAHAELYAMREAMAELIALLKDLVCTIPNSANWAPFTLHEDNMAAAYYAQSLGQINKKKHIALRVLWCAHLVSIGLVEIKWCPTNDMIADIFGKSVPKAMFRYCNGAMTGNPYERKDGPGDGAATAAPSPRARSQDAILFKDPEGKFGYLTNFYRAGVLYDGKQFVTNEHAFQCAKMRLKSDSEEIRNTPSADEAAAMGRDRSRPIHSDWDARRIDVMRAINLAKFDQHPSLLARLVSTASRTLVERSDRDAFWGDGPDRQGLNHLGLILMSIRDQLRHRVSRGIVTEALRLEDKVQEARPKCATVGCHDPCWPGFDYCRRSCPVNSLSRQNSQPGKLPCIIEGCQRPRFRDHKFCSRTCGNLWRGKAIPPAPDLTPSPGPASPPDGNDGRRQPPGRTLRPTELHLFTYAE